MLEMNKNKYKLPTLKVVELSLPRPVLAVSLENSSEDMNRRDWEYSDEWE